METEKRKDYFRPILGDEIGQALRGCEMSARGFFYEIYPRLQAASPPGFLRMETPELSAVCRASEQKTRHYVAELKRHHILREMDDGTLVCPAVIRQFVNRGSKA